MLETVMIIIIMIMMMVVVVKLKTKGFCNEIPLCEVVELCGFYSGR
jgi:hypothetical protein